MSRRIFREFMVMGCSIGGAVIGYCAASGMEPTAELALSFLGMALGGAFAEICTRGRA
jgi:hypothetical protein